MSTHTERRESALLAEDQAFLERSMQMFESMGAFVLARLFEDEPRPRLARDVLVYRDTPISCNRSASRCAGASKGRSPCI